MRETQISNPTERAPTVYEQCDQCSSPVEKNQRYCVACGARNKRADDPVAKYLAVATSRSRAAKASGPVRARARRGPGLGTAAVIAAIPLAVALGVIVGRANSGGDAKLIAALRAQKAPVVTVTGTGAATGTAQASLTRGSVRSTFSLAQGYAVELRTLAARGSDQSSVTNAEQAATARGATAVGVIAGTGFSVSPKPAGDVYIVYSGQFKTKPEAQAALAKLKRRFPGALVIAVRSASGSSSSSSSGGGNQVKASATKSQLAQGAQEVHQISHATGHNYVQAQNNLPGQISIP